jgi:hypothetical protein
MTRPLLNLSPILFLGLLGCQPDDKDQVDTGETGSTAPLFDGPFTYDSVSDGQDLIDTLWMVTEEAVEEIAAGGETPEEYLNWRIDAVNDTLARSLVDSSRLRSLGVHVVTTDDEDRTGIAIGQTDVNISTALSWLSTYRDAYGADKVMIVAGTNEGASGAALGGGDVSAHWVTFLPVEHEFGHQMGGGHCNEGNAGALNYGFPLTGYDEDGYPNAKTNTNAPQDGGTRMCGNNVALFSNPDLYLTVDEVKDLVDQGLAPSGNWSALTDDDGLIRFGHPTWANMAQQWRDVEASAAEKIPTALYEGAAAEPYPFADCIGLYAEEGYGDFIDEICEGEEVQDLSNVRSVQVGSEVHTNLYSDADFGADSMCGGQMQRLAYSSPSLDALSDHQGIDSLADRVSSVAVYAPTDRWAHFRNEGPYKFYGAGTDPLCQGSTGNELVLMPDNRDWAATAAVYQSGATPPFSVEFDLKTSHSNADPQADGFTFFFGKSETAFQEAAPDRGQLGVVKEGTGYAVFFNTWTRQIGVRDTNWEPVGSDVSHPANTQAEWVNVRIEVQMDGIEVFWGETSVLSASHTWSTAHDSVGFTAGTGYYTAEYRLKDIAFNK